VNNNAANTLWNEACKHLQEILHSDTYARWIAVITPCDLKDGVLTLAVDNDFYQTWLEENYLPLIKNALASVSDEVPTVTFMVRPQGVIPKPEEPKKHKTTIRERLLSRAPVRPSLNPKFTFDTFVVGSSNHFSHAACLAVAQAPAHAYNPLFIYGDVGLGKTHLMQAIGHQVLTKASAHVSYLSSEALLNEYIESLQSRTLVEFRKKYRSTDLLLIDDIHFLAGKERLQEEFFHTFNALFDSRKQIVMTSDRPASEIAGLEQRLVSRFEWGLVTELQHPDLETRIAILRNKLVEMNAVLDDQMILFIAENIRQNVRRLEGALVRSISYASLTGQNLTLDSLKHLLRDAIDRQDHVEVTFDAIQRAVAEHYDVRLADMSSKRRAREVSVPRQVAMFLCRSLTRSSLPDIANAFSKTHATVLHAFRTVESRMDVDPDLKRNVETISRKLSKEPV